MALYLCDKIRIVDANSCADAYSCVDTDREISLDEQYATVDKYSIAGLFSLKVFLNSLLCEISLSRSRLFDSHSAPRHGIKFMPTPVETHII